MSKVTVTYKNVSVPLRELGVECRSGSGERLRVVNNLDTTGNRVIFSFDNGDGGVGSVIMGRATFIEFLDGLIKIREDETGR